jgi:signal transduction histidine kinase
MILKEAINNSIKYAEANALTLEVSIVKGKLNVFIKDDGKGFNISEVTEGNGIRNMRTRAAQIHYDIKIFTSQGTSIQLQKL